MPPKFRGPRVTTGQLECLLEFINKNKILISGKTHPLNINQINLLWGELTNQLNILDSPNKTVDEWKRFFIEFKSKTKKKAREISTNIRCTGGGGHPKMLNDMEERLMGLIGWVTVKGSSDLPEELNPSTEVNDKNIWEDESDKEYINSLQSQLVNDEDIDELDEVVKEPSTLESTITSAAGKQMLLACFSILNISVIVHFRNVCL